MRETVPASDGTDFGRTLSLFFRDPDAMECEALVPNPEPGKFQTGKSSHQYRS